MASLQEIVFGIYSMAGPELTRIMLAYPQLNPFEDKNNLILDEKKAQSFIAWFYSEIPLDRVSPYEICKSGKQDYLEARLIALAQGNVSS